MKVTPSDCSLPLESISRKVRLVILESPYDTIGHPLAQNLLGKIAHLKITGYKAEYPYGATPVDTGDFLGTHLLLCEDDGLGNLSPLMGFKSITHERCQTHDFEFPAFHLFPKVGYEQHSLAVERLVRAAEHSGEQIAYNGSWTVRGDVRADRTLMQLCYDVTVLLLVRYYVDYKIENILAGATVRFKVHQFKEFMGWEYVKSGDVKLAHFPCKPFFNETVALMYLRRFSPAAHRLADRYHALWDQRLTLTSSNADPALRVRLAA